MSEVTLESQLFDIIKDKEMPEHVKLAKVDMLVTLGVDINGKYGAKSFLLVARECGNKAVYDFMKKAGAREYIDPQVAKELGRELVVNFHSISKIDELINAGANLEEKNDKGWTTLEKASYWGYKEVVELLIEKGALVNDKTDSGMTALMWASYWGHKDVVELLIEKGADVNAKNECDETALYYASYNDCKEIVKLLIEKGADFKIRNKKGKTALSIARKNETRDAIIEAIKQRNIKEKGFIVGSLKNLFER